MLWTEQQGQVLRNQDLILEQASDVSDCILARTLWWFCGSRAVVCQGAIAVAQEGGRGAALRKQLSQGWKEGDHGSA